MDQQYTDAKEIYFNLINGQEYTLCVAGAPVNGKLQFCIPSTSSELWMDYPGQTFAPVGSGGLSNSANVVIRNFYAFSVKHRVVFDTIPASTYWYCIAVVTMPEY